MAPSVVAQPPSAQSDATPWGIHTAFGVDPSTTVSLGWLQPRNADQLAALENRRVVVEYGETTAYGLFAHIEARPYASVATQTPFVAYLTGLKPGTTYHYRIGSTVPGWSPDHSFTTAPTMTDSFTVTAWGDQGTGRQIQADTTSTAGTPATHPSRMVVAAAIAEQPDLQLHLGDLSYDDWDEWQWIIEPLAANVPYMVAAGNHDIDEERNIKEYDARMIMPSAAGTYYYAFTYGHTRFVALDSENWCVRGFSQYEPAAGVYYGCVEPRAPNAAQLAFIESEFEQARADPAIRFIVPFFHKPMLSDGEHGSSWYLQEAWGELFDRYRPELVLTGHDHLYERTKPVLHDGSLADGGTTYIVSGGAGHGIYEFQNETPPLWEAARAGEYHFTLLEFQGDEVTVTAKDLNGTVIDSVTIHSNADTWAQVSAAEPPRAVPDVSLVLFVGGLLLVAARRRRRAKEPRA